MFNIPTSSEIITKSAQTIKRFPLVFLSSIVLAFISIYLIEIEPKKMEGLNLILAKVALSASLAVFIFTGVRLLGETLLKPRSHLFLVLGASVVLLAYYFTLPQNSEDFSANIIPFRHFFLSLLFFIALLWAPFTRSSLSNEDYWEYAKGVLFAYTMAFSFTFIVVLGVNAALFTVEKLFDLDIDVKRFFQLDILIVAVFSVGYFLSQIPSKPLESKQSLNPPNVEKFYTKWILTPLSVLYFLILYAYTFKLLLNFDLPKGVLAWLIVAFSMVLILTYLFWTHFTQENRWRRWIWLAIFLQTLMLFIAIGIRIEEYSWTESRYMVSVLGLWLAVISLYFLLFKKAQIKWIFISMSLFIALTQFGPLSAYTISKNAQMQRLQSMIAELKTYEKASKAPLKLRYEITDALRYLHRRYRGESLALMFPKITQKFKEIKVEHTQANYLPNFITKKLGFKAINSWEYRKLQNGEKESFAFYTNRDLCYNAKNQRVMMDIKDYDYMSQINFSDYHFRAKETSKAQEIRFKDLNLTLRYTREHQLIISNSDSNLSVDIENFMQDLIKNFGQTAEELNTKELTIKKENKKFKIKLQLNSIRQEYFDGNKSIELNGVFFIKL